MPGISKLVGILLVLSLAVPIAGCDATRSDAYRSLQAEKVGLDEQLRKLSDETAALRQELERWKADPQANFKQLHDQLETARTTADFVRVQSDITSFLGRFPQTDLRGPASDLLARAGDGQKRAAKAEEEARRVAEAARAKEQAERERREFLAGTPTTYRELREMALTGMTPGKRYRLTACVRPRSRSSVEIGLKLMLIPECEDPTLRVVAMLDDDVMLHDLVRMEERAQMRTIVVSLLNGSLVLHRLE